jgi:hypothetical protein
MPDDAEWTRKRVEEFHEYIPRSEFDIAMFPVQTNPSSNLAW